MSDMTDKELKRLNRAELLEMLIAQSKKLARVEEELAEAKKELEERNIAVADSGTLAEASLKLSGIFEDADKAAAIYLEQAKEREAEAERVLEEAKKLAQQAKRAAEKREISA